MASRQVIPLTIARQTPGNTQHRSGRTSTQAVRLPVVQLRKDRTAITTAPQKALPRLSGQVAVIPLRPVRLREADLTQHLHTPQEGAPLLRLPGPVAVAAAAAEAAEVAVEEEASEARGNNSKC
jgi:hypothetical protein